MATTNAMLTTLAATIAGATGSAGASKTELDTIPPMGPSQFYCTLGRHRGRAVPGSWEQLIYRVPFRLYVERTSDEATLIATLNDAFDAVTAALRSGITLGGLATYATIADWDTQRTYKVGEMEYESVDGSFELVVSSGQTYTP